MPSFVDDFNRPDNDDLGSPWVANAATNAISISGNRVICDNPTIGGVSGRSERYEAGIGADQYSQAVLTDADANSFGALGVRIHLDSTIKGYYYGKVDVGNGIEDHRIIKDNDMSAIIASATYPTNGGFAWVAGRTLKIQVVGTTIKVFVNGVEAVSGLDGSYVAGSPGFGCPGGIAGSLTGFDNWEGGDVSTVAAIVKVLQALGLDEYGESVFEELTASGERIF